MEAYNLHIKDVYNTIGHLTEVERSVYSALIKLYYKQAGPLDADNFAWLAKQVGVKEEEELNALENVLEEFFILDGAVWRNSRCDKGIAGSPAALIERSEEHTSELQSRGHLVCRLLLE